MILAVKVGLGGRILQKKENKNGKVEKRIRSLFIRNITTNKFFRECKNDRFAQEVKNLFKK